MQRSSPFSPSPHSSIPSSPVVTVSPHQHQTHSSPLSAADSHASQRRILLPTTRPTRTPPRQTRSRTGRLSRQSRSNSIGSELQNKDSQEWALSLGKMNVVDQLEIRGYQTYAVEKWVVERGRLINVVSVYTGNPDHKIHVTALSPFSSLTDSQAQAEFDNAVHILRRDGARPRETEHGVILITSLSNFRSDYNLVLIPDGNFLAAREQLYVNINLLRMGCSGRTALTLHEPSEPTKDRYLSMYCFSESVLFNMSFNHCVLELVKLVQSALALFGMFEIASDERDGLLCDITAEGIQRWTDQVGEPILFLEPMERVGDPSVVAAILSLVVATRNRLQSLGFTQVPKDPFQDPAGFLQAAAPLAAPLTREAIEHINSLCERRAPEYRVPRIILGKLDEVAAELNLRGTGDPACGPVYATADLAGFVQIVLGSGGRDAVESLKSLWTGRATTQQHHHHHWLKPRGTEEDERGTEGKSTEEEDGAQQQRIFQGWPKHMKIDGLKGFDFGLSRVKKPSMDLGIGGKLRKPLSGDESVAAQPGPSTLLPALVITGDSETALTAIRSRDSGAEGSAPSVNPSSLGLSPVTSPRSSHINLASPEQSLPKGRPSLPSRLPSSLSTTSDPLASPREERRAFLRRSSAYEQRHDDGYEETELENERRANRGLLLGATRRRHSMHDLSAEMRERRLLAVERMKIDVGLCGQYIIMRRRELHLRHMIALLQHLQSTLQTKNKCLQGDLAVAHAPLEAATSVRKEVWAALRNAEARCEEWTSTHELLHYQTEQMAMKHLWHSVRHQRRRVLAARQAVFAAPLGTRPVPGTASRRFFRVQTTLDPEDQRLVDWAGRTESEAEEESVMPREEGVVVWPPPYEELRAYAVATRTETPRRWWWWPFGGRDTGGKGSDDETSAAATAQGEEPTETSPAF